MWGTGYARPCFGLVAFDQVYSFDTDTFLNAIPRPDDLEETAFRAAAAELFARLQQLADNAGATDEHRPWTTWPCATPPSTPTPPNSSPNPWP